VRRIWNFIWIKEFQERRKDVTGNEITHNLATSGTDPNVERLPEVARSDH
jgi:hypothetical protein